MPHLSPPSVPSAAGWVLGGRDVAALSWLSRALPSSARTPPAHTLEEEGHGGITLRPSLAHGAPGPTHVPRCAHLCRQAYADQVAADVCASPVQTPVPPISLTPGNSPHLIEDDRGTPGHTATFAAPQTPHLRVPAPLPPSAPTPASSEAGSSLGLYDFTPASHQPVSPRPWMSTALTL